MQPIKNPPLLRSLPRTPLLPIVAALLAANTKLVQSIFDRVQACREENDQASKEIAKQQGQKQAAQKTRAKRLESINMPRSPFVH